MCSLSRNIYFLKIRPILVSQLLGSSFIERNRSYLEEYIFLDNVHLSLHHKIEHTDILFIYLHQLPMPPLRYSSPTRSAQFCLLFFRMNNQEALEKTSAGSPFEKPISGTQLSHLINIEK